MTEKTSAADSAATTFTDAEQKLADAQSASKSVQDAQNKANQDLPAAQSVADSTAANVASAQQAKSAADAAHKRTDFAAAQKALTAQEHNFEATEATLATVLKLDANATSRPAAQSLTENGAHESAYSATPVANAVSAKLAATGATADAVAIVSTM